jgi:hypothetical protein
VSEIEELISSNLLLSHNGGQPNKEESYAFLG